MVRRLTNFQGPEIKAIDYPLQRENAAEFARLVANEGLSETANMSYIQADQIKQIGVEIQAGRIGLKNGLQEIQVILFSNGASFAADVVAIKLKQNQGFLSSIFMSNFGLLALGAILLAPYLRAQLKKDEF